MATVLVTSSHNVSISNTKPRTTTANWESGRVVSFQGRLVNQGLKKIKLEEDFVPIKLETNVTTEAAFEDRDGGDWCTDEVDSLKNAVEQLTLQVKKQKEMITNIKSSLRNAVQTVLTSCKEDTIEDNCDRGGESDGHDAVTSAPTFRSLSAVVTREDVESLTNVVTQLTLQVKKQKAVITNITSGLRTAVLTVLACCQEDEIEDDRDLGGDGNDVTIGRHDIRYHTDGGPSTIGKHVALKTRARIFLCRHCPRFFSTLADRRLHTRQVHGFPTVKAADGSLGQNRARCSMVVDPAVANMASSKVGDEEVYERGSDKDEGQTSPFQCNLCRREFNSRNAALYHIQSVHHGVRYKCTECPGTFTQSSSLQKHINQVHKVGGPPTQKCGICGAHLLQGDLRLKTHMTITHRHAKEKGVERA